MNTGYAAIPEPKMWPVLVCMLGHFRVLTFGARVALRGGGKGETFLRILALDPKQPTQRDKLLDALWPDTDATLAGQSLSSLVYSLQKLFTAALDGKRVIAGEDGCYALNREAGVGVDVECFEALALEGDCRSRAGDEQAAIATYQRAVNLYQGDLCAPTELQSIVECERLRARYQSLLAHLAEYCLSQGDVWGCEAYASQLLAVDACREDAHRLLMRCAVASGERAKALHQYKVCAALLRKEFDAEPELATTVLFDQIRRGSR